MKQWRAAVVALACGGFLAVAPSWLPPLPAARSDTWWPWLTADPQRAVTLLTSLAAYVIAGWLLIVAALTLLAASARRSGLLARRALNVLTPHVARGLVRVLLGAAVAVSTAGPAVAGELPGLAPVPAPVVAAPELPPVLDLDRPGAAAPKPAPRMCPPHRLLPERHRVRPGDTLWGLGATRLPAGSSPAAITRAWQRWYAVNRETIGADPGLLLRRRSSRRSAGREVRAPVGRGGAWQTDGALALRTDIPSPATPALVSHGAEVPGGAQRAAVVLARGLLEVLAGIRPPGQLCRWTTSALLYDLERRAPRRPTGQRQQLLRVRVTEQAPGVAEACALTKDLVRGRVRVMAMRMELRGEQWIVTRLSAG